MERAIFITKVSQLEYANRGFTRLYYGNEFCERLIPCSNGLKRILSYVNKNKLDLSLVTPYVTNRGFQRLEPLFKLLKDTEKVCEVIVNDWGVLSLINHKYPNLTPVLGRLLTKQKRSPELERLIRREVRPRLIQDPQNPKLRVLIFQKKIPLQLDPYYKGSNTSSVPIIHNFLSNQRINRIELDNTGQGLFLELTKNKIYASVYFPYAYISTTFFCLSAGCSSKNTHLFKVKPCNQECQKYVFKLRHKSMPQVIYLKGNTQFYKNSRLQLKEWEKIGVDRVVYEPEIPV